MKQNTQPQSVFRFINTVKKLLLTATILLWGASFASQAHNLAAAPQAAKSEKKVQKDKMKAENQEKRSKEKSEAKSSENTKTKADGTPDKRYKENKNLKKDGTPDKRFKENKGK
jgi:hypothetical protein